MLFNMKHLYKQGSVLWKIYERNWAGINGEIEFISRKESKLIAPMGTFDLSKNLCVDYK